jgi:hypothetical protein
MFVATDFLVTFTTYINIFCTVMQEGLKVIACCFTSEMYSSGMSILYIQSWLISKLMHKILIYLYIIHFLKSYTCFEHCPAYLQEVYVVIVYMQPLVSSLSAGDCPVHRLRRKFFLNRCTRQSPVESDDTRGCIYTITT